MCLSDAEKLAVRMIHGSGQVDLATDLVVHPRLIGAARAALEAGAPILCDATMVATGVTRTRLPSDNQVLCLLGDERTAHLARQWGTTRTAAAVSLWEPHLDGAVVAIGNAPTALFHLLEMILDGSSRPAAIVGCPVGFIGAALGHDLLRAQRAGPGAGNEPRMTGRFVVVGVGPGDPELVTLKAARIIGAAEVVAYHAGVHQQSHARRIAARFIPAGAAEEELRYPVTTGSTAHPGGYTGAMAQFYESCAQRLAVHLDAGRDAVLLAEGDPLFYGSAMYLLDRFTGRYRTSVVPGVPAFAAATAAIPAPLVRQADVLAILPGTLPEPELARRLADTDGASRSRTSTPLPSRTSP